MDTSGLPGELRVWAPDGIGEVEAGTDLADLIARAHGPDLTDGDIVAVGSKVVSKAEGRHVDGDRDAAVDAETVRVVAQRGPVRIVRNRLGLTMAAAGVDASNVAAGTALVLPLDPDATARRLRAGLRQRLGRNLAILITDTAGRAWRDGQTDLTIGCAGLLVLDDHAGRVDHYGNTLAVTAPAVADELAAAAELVRHKLGRRPVAILRGRADLVLPPGEDGPGAASLIRPEGGDLFGYGAREAVARALLGARGRDPHGTAPFGLPTPTVELLPIIAEVLPEADCRPAGDELRVTADESVLPLAAALGYAHGWLVSESGAESDAESGADRTVHLRPAGSTRPA